MFSPFFLSFLIFIFWCDETGEEKASGDINVILSAASCNLSVDGVPPMARLEISVPLLGVLTLLLLVLIFKSSVTLVLNKGLIGSFLIFARAGSSVEEAIEELGVTASFLTMARLGDFMVDSSGVRETELL